MRKIGLSFALLLLFSGCSSFIEEPPVQDQKPSVEQIRNEQLQQEAAVLREEVRLRKQELGSLSQ